MTRKSKRKSSLSGLLIERYYSRKKYLTRIVVAICIVVGLVSSIVSYFLTAYFSKQVVVEMILIQVLFAFLGLAADFMVSPRFVFLTSLFIGIGAGAAVRVIWT